MGGPGSGKTTTAARLFADLTIHNVDIEPVHEYVKHWAIEKRHVGGFDQNYIHAKQIYAEERLLRHVGHIVTDSPLLLCAYYSMRNGFRGYKHLIEMSKEFENEYPSINIFLDRNGISYVPSKRYQSEFEAGEVDREMEGMLQSLSTSFVKIPTLDYELVLWKTLELLDVQQELSTAKRPLPRSGIESLLT